jgi:6-phosphogluconate dehydrogenase
MVSKLSGTRVVWLMLPSGIVTENAFQEVLGLLGKNDIIIDGANSNFSDSIRRHKQAAGKTVRMLDVGVSGGILGADKGYPLMVGGSREAYTYCRPVFDALSPKGGFGLVGGPGAGHYVKMVHNAIEYGMMQSIAEGFDLLKNGSIKGLDLHKISGIWNNGTIIESLLLEMANNALARDKRLKLQPYVEDSGEGRWAAIDAMEHSVPFVVNTYALHSRYLSRDKNSLAHRLLAAIRQEFGGHEVKK